MAVASGFVGGGRDRQPRALLPVPVLLCRLAACSGVVVLEAELLIALVRIVLAGRLARRLAQPVEQNRAERVAALLHGEVIRVVRRRRGRLGAHDARALARSRAARAPDPRVLLVVEEHEWDEQDRHEGQAEAQWEHPPRVLDLISLGVQCTLRATHNKLSTLSSTDAHSIERCDM